MPATLSKTRRPASRSATRYRIITTSLGEFVLMQTPDGRLRTTWVAEGDEQLDDMQRDDRLLSDLSQRLSRYFDGVVEDFRDVPTPEGSEFFARCWAACRRIPRGETVSYARLAEMAGSDARASRAAGQAMRRNPLPVIVPCHRVVASTGALHGFAGSTDPDGQALTLKRALLALESGRLAREPAGRRRSD